MPLTKVPYAMIEGSPVNVLDFGATGDGNVANATANTAAMNAAHATGKLVYYPSGDYRFNGTVTFSSGGIIGDGQGETFLVSTDTSSADLIKYTGTSSALFSDFQIQGPGVSKSSGYGLNFDPGAGATCSYATIQNVNFNILPVGINFERADQWKVINCNFINYTVYGMQINNLTNGDAGDSAIIACQFNRTLTTGVGINQIGSGGLKIVGCKFNGGANGYVLAYNPERASSILLITGNSFENHAVSHISLTRTAGAFTFINIAISGNQFNASPLSISTDSSGFIAEMAITGNVFNISTDGTSISLNAVENLGINGNVFNAGNRPNTTAISLTNVTNGKIGSNVYYGFTAGQYNSIFGGTVNVNKDSLQGSINTLDTGWSSYGTLYVSPETNITFSPAFKVAPAAEDIQVFAGSTNGAIGGYVVPGTITTTGCRLQALSSVNSIVATLKWKAWGVV